MYRWLLCFRYLRTRYIALASIISVTLGVATMIVVNSVMEGFSAEMNKRIHGILSDVVIDCHTTEGLVDPDAILAEVRRVAGDDIEGATAVVHVPAMLNFKWNGQTITRQVNVVGIDEKTYATVSDFSQYLLHPLNRKELQFTLREGDYAPERTLFPESGWPYRKSKARYEQLLREEQQRMQAFSPLATADATGGSSEANPSPDMPLETPPGDANSDANATASAIASAAASGPNLGGIEHQGGRAAAPMKVFNPATEQHCSVVLGIATCSTRGRTVDGEVYDHFYARPGDDVQLMFPTASDQPRVVNQFFTVVDFYESKMSEYDATFAFVPIAQLQQFRGMIDPTSGKKSVTSIQLRLREGANLNVVRDKLRARYPIDQYAYEIQTWQDMQGPLLQAVQLETTLLNILLFLIIAVAGFGILATFFMIVVEKTRDIGILKSLGASGTGVMSIFLNYGLLLGITGSGVGLLGGLLFVRYINDIANGLEWFSGREIFDPTVYYFDRIPTITHASTVIWVVVGATFIAVAASILPAIRAARMHPVQSLRYE
jgi:lipoprotein-releasing system permease protein